jgi:hypothetical protein
MSMQSLSQNIGVSVDALPAIADRIDNARYILTSLS